MAKDSTRQASPIKTINGQDAKAYLLQSAATNVIGGLESNTDGIN